MTDKVAGFMRKPFPMQLWLIFVLLGLGILGGALLGALGALAAVAIIFVTLFGTFYEAKPKPKKDEEKKEEAKA